MCVNTDGSIGESALFDECADLNDVDSIVRSETGGLGAHSGRLASNVLPWRPRARASAPILRSIPRLLSCSLELHDATHARNGFLAMVTDDEAVFRDRVTERYGAGALGRTLFGAGHGWRNAISEMLVSEIVADMLATAADDPASEISQGFEVALELGFIN